VRRASIDTSLDPTYGLVRASLAGKIARGGARCSSLTYHFLSSVVWVVPLFVPLAPWSVGGGDREDVALSYVYGDSGCVAASWLCVLWACLCLCVAGACRHHLSSVHPYRVGVQSEPGCSSPYYLPTYSTVRWVKRNRSPPLRSLCRVLCGCGRRLAGVVLPMGED